MNTQQQAAQIADSEGFNGDGSKVPDTVTTLFSNKPLVKKWLKDGTIKGFGKALWFKAETHQVGSLEDMGLLLKRLERDPSRCIIRGRLRENWKQIQRDNLPAWEARRRKTYDAKVAAGLNPGAYVPLVQPGPDWLLRRKELFEDLPHHWLLLDVDGFPVKSDDPLEQIGEYQTAMSESFRRASFAWQLSNSAGHPDNVGALKAHLWFWADQMYKCSELAIWAEAINRPSVVAGMKLLVDPAVLNSTVQMHYTGGPIFEQGVANPIAQRSGYEDKSLVGGPAVVLDISEGMRKKAAAPAKGKAELVDPRKKPGWIGAFHRAITIEEAVDRFIPEEFDHVAGDRWTWNGGSGAAEGVFVREDRQGLGASHGTWPWGMNHTANTFDIVRHFLFGHLDETDDDLIQAMWDVSPANRNSHSAMMEMIKTLPEVQLEMLLGNPADTPDMASKSAAADFANEVPDEPDAARDAETGTAEGALPKARPSMADAAQAGLQQLPQQPDPFPGPMADAVAATLLASHKPQPALATLAVLVGMAACCNGSYHLRGSRLNIYGVGIAGTGWGKDLPRTAAVAIAIAGGAKVIGKPGSGQGLEDALVDSQGMLCEIDEMAHLLAAINGSKAPAYLIELAGNLLKLFSAGANSYNTRSLARAQGRVAARRLMHPCTNIIGFATPEKLGESVGVSNVEDGLLGRLLFAFGQSGVQIRRSQAFSIPESVQQAATRVNGFHFDDVLFAATANREVEIATDQDADLQLLELMREFDEHAMQGRSSFSKALLTRSFEKCQRIAGVLAVWDNPVAPVITMGHVDWAEQMVRASDAAALHFCGEYMHGGQVQADAATVSKMINRILNGDFQPQRANEITLLKSGKVAHSFLLRSTKLDKRRFDDAIGQLVDLAEIRREVIKGEQSNGKSFSALAFSRSDG